MAIHVHNLINSVATPQTLMILSVVSEVLGIFRAHPAAYVCKVCVDMPKEVIKIMVLSK